MADQELDRDLETIASEIEGVFMSGKVRGVCAIMIMDDGRMIQRVRYIPGGGLPMVAACTLMTHAVVDMVKRQGEVPDP